MRGDRFVSMRSDSNISYRRLRLGSIISISDCNLSFLIIVDDALAVYWAMVSHIIVESFCHVKIVVFVLFVMRLFLAMFYIVL